jgi:uncharacterized repeat protein (TIGR01451 family)
MKKLLLSFLILFCLQFKPLKAQWVTIPDTNFVNKLTQLYPSCMNGNQMDTTCTEIVNETQLDVLNSNIYDLSGVQYFTNLNQLYCDFNYLTSLPTLPSLLQIITCGHNQLTSLPTLPISLIRLQCGYNQLNSLPALTNTLERLFCFNNQLTSLPQLPNTLIELNCSSNQLTSIPSLPASLLSFITADNQLSNISSLPNNLQSFNCAVNQFYSLPTLPPNLVELSCSQNQLTTLPNLPNTLKYLSCGYNQLNSLPSLPGDMLTLDCMANQLTSVPTLPDSLHSLYCNYNQLTSLPYLPNTIHTLQCSYNQLNSLPSVPNLMLSFLINNNNISCLVNLPIVADSINGNIANNPLTCVPNQTNYSLGLPFCVDNDILNNPNNCTNVCITGYVYTDQNNNCIHQNNDLPTENIPVKLYDGQNNFVGLSYTTNGVYSFGSLLPDSFTVNIEDIVLPVSMACGQSNNQNAILDSANQTISGLNFPILCNEFDLNVQAVNRQGIVFPGQVHRLYTHITNNETWYNLDCGSSNYSGTVTISVTGPVSYFSIPPGALTPSITGNTFTYLITDFISLTPASFGLNFKTDTTAQAGDQICVHVEINPTPLDGDTTNNVYDFCYQVVNSYDPNMKEVYPVNVLPGYDDWFTYTIHFQNTGNAPAFNIRLRDTLDANLDINSFEVHGYSHPAQISINGNILTVRFNNILLPDSTADYDGSMGYFQYRLKPLANLPNGTQIENTAYIYFDYNAPIITNTTQNNFDMTVKINDIELDETQYILYPNPGTGLFMFKENKNIKTVEVFNMMGELVLSQGNAKIINLQGYPKGIYVARINGTQVCRLVKE